MSSTITVTQSIPSVPCKCKLCEARIGDADTLESTPRQTWSPKPRLVLMVRGSYGNADRVFFGIDEDLDGTLYWCQGPYSFDEDQDGRGKKLSPEDVQEQRGYQRVEVNFPPRTSRVESPYQFTASGLNVDLSRLRITDSAVGPTDTPDEASPSPTSSDPEWFLEAMEHIRSAMRHIPWHPSVIRTRQARQYWKFDFCMGLYHKVPHMTGLTEEEKLDYQIELVTKPVEEKVWKKYLASVKLYVPVLAEAERVGGWKEEEEEPVRIEEAHGAGFREEQWMGMQGNVGLGISFA